MGQEFIIKSQVLEDKINQLLPSQGGFQAGVDLSASTQIVPIIDLTESAEGSNVRADLQTALSFATSTAFTVFNTTTSIITTTGYFRVFGSYRSTTTNTSSFILNDGVSTKTLSVYFNDNTFRANYFYDFVVFMEAGDSLQATSNSNFGTLDGVTRQIADLAGNLVNP